MLQHKRAFWTETLETRGRTDVIHTDFEKVFDKVPHRRSSELKSYKLHSSIIDWIQNFITDRKQRVRVDGEFSCWAKDTTGVNIEPTFAYHIYKRLGW